MKKSSHQKFLILSFLIFCFLIGCSQNTSIKKIVNYKDRKIIKAHFTFKTKLEKLNAIKFEKALTLINSYLNTKEFKNLVLNGPKEIRYIHPNEYQTNSCNGIDRATYTYNTVNKNCFNNRDLYEVIKSADWNIRLEIKPYMVLFNCKSPLSNTIAAVEEKIIIVDECRLKHIPVEYLAGTLIHEYLHVIGFHHPYSPSKNRKYTIPYFIGNAAIKKFMNKNDGITEVPLFSNSKPSLI